MTSDKCLLENMLTNVMGLEMANNEWLVMVNNYKGI